MSQASIVDRWIYVFTAASFIVITLAGFIPDSLDKIAQVQSGARPPFPMILHVHAVLMGSFLLVLLLQTTLVAVGRTDLHRRLGIAGFVLAASIVVVGLLLVPTMYRYGWNAAQTAPPAMRAPLQRMVLMRDNVMLLQLRIGLLFPLFLMLAVRARAQNAGLHKRMILLATVVALVPSISRMAWLPNTLPKSPLSSDLYMVLAVSPMLVWDVLRHRTVHRAYLIWFAALIPTALTVYGLWGTPWWHEVAPRLMGV